MNCASGTLNPVMAAWASAGSEPRRLRGDRALAIGKQDFGGGLGNGFDRAEAVLRVAHGHADVECFDFHGRHLTKAVNGWTQILPGAGGANGYLSFNTGAALSFRCQT